MERDTNKLPHTPGPWFNYPQHPDRFSIGAYRHGSLCIVVAESKPREIITASGDESILEDEALANAKLIAAGPDMLKALRAIVSQMEMHSPMREGSEKELSDAIAAIKKATK